MEQGVIWVHLHRPDLHGMDVEADGVTLFAVEFGADSVGDVVVEIPVIADVEMRGSIHQPIALQPGLVERLDAAALHGHAAFLTALLVAQVQAVLIPVNGSLADEVAAITSLRDGVLAAVSAGVG